MRVLFGIGGLPPGGSETQLLRLMQETHGTMLQASLVTLSGVASDEARAAVGDLKISWTAMNSGRGPRSLRPAVRLPRLLKILRQERPDVVYPWLEETATAMVPVAKMLGVPAVVARRNISGAYVERKRPVGWMVRRVERAANLVTVNSLAVAASAEARGISAERIRLIRNGHPPLPPLAFPSNTVNLGYLANFRREKGHSLFVEALSRLPVDPPWRATLGGVGPLRDQVQEEVIRHGLGDRVELIGQVREAREFWAACHIAVLLSDHEGSPNALIEAGFAGRPLVGTAVGGTRELVGNSTGFLVEPGNADEAASRLTALIHDALLREKLGRNAHEQFSTTFAQDRCVSGHVAAIGEALEGG